MKRLLRLFPMLLLCVCALTACGGDDNDDSDDTTEGKNGEYVINGHKFVDLGLPSGLLWADSNIGATDPEELGYSYRWGETEAFNYKVGYKFKVGDTYTKYNRKDAKTTLEPEDDAATVLWGKNCRMPTRKEADELLTNCKWTFSASDDGGATVTGPNGNHIYFRISGGLLFYRTSSFDTTYPTDHCAYSLQVSKTYTAVVPGTSRDCPMYVRPVAEK